MSMFVRRISGMDVEERRLDEGHEQAEDQAEMERRVQAFIVSRRGGICRKRTPGLYLERVTNSS